MKLENHKDTLIIAWDVNNFVYTQFYGHKGFDMTSESLADLCYNSIYDCILDKQWGRKRMIWEPMEIVAFVHEHLKKEKHIFCFDSKHSYRKELFPDYKGNRKAATPEEKKNKSIVFEAIVLLRKQLKKNGYRCLLSRGLEADDLIAALHVDIVSDFWDSGVFVKPFKHPYLGVLCVSNDKDFDVCGVPRFSLRDKKTYSTYFEATQNFIKKTITGCTTDNVPNLIKGIGEAGADAYIRFYTTTRNPHQKQIFEEAKKSAKVKSMAEKIAAFLKTKEGNTAYLMNQDLIKIPFNSLILKHKRHERIEL